MAFMNRSDGLTKLQSVVHTLTGCDRRRSYYLSIATCYCTPQAVSDFIAVVQAEVNLVEIYLYVDRRTAISIGQAELADLENAYPDLLSVYAVRAGRLFHTKGYCLAAYAGDELVHGRLAIGSANLTNAGLTGAHGNIETLAIHSDIATINEFLEFFDSEENLLTLDDLTDFSPDDTTDFQYALLTCGLFSHKWSATLAAYFSVRFRLNEEGRRRAQEGIDTPGFQMEAATIAKSYFDFNLQGWQLNDRNLIRNFGIECFLGHWIPKSVLEGDVEKNEHFDQFKSALFEELESGMDSNCREILQDYDSLIQEGIIDEPETDPAQGFRDRIASLRNDRDQLYRIWSGRHFFEFPYDLSDVDAIQETFEDILRTARRRRRKNRSMNAVLEAEMRKTLEPVQDLLVADR